MRYFVQKKVPLASRKMSGFKWSGFVWINLACCDLFLLLNAPIKIKLELYHNMFNKLGPAVLRPFLCKVGRSTL